MSFLVVFKGQFSPFVHTPTKESVQRVSSPGSADAVEEFEDVLEEVIKEEEKPHPRKKLEIYQQVEKKFKEERKRQYAKDIMSFPVKFISESTSATVAQKMFREAGFRHLPVLDEANNITGMISIHELSGDVETKRCSEVMLHKVVVCEEQTSINEIAIIFLKEKINALPIINHKRELIGIITLSDILKYVVESTPFLGKG